MGDDFFCLVFSLYNKSILKAYSAKKYPLEWDNWIETSFFKNWFEDLDYYQKKKLSTSIIYHLINNKWTFRQETQGKLDSIQAISPNLKGLFL